MSQRDGLGSASHAPKLSVSGTKGTINIPAVVQQWEVVLDGPEGTAFWLITAELPVSLEGPVRDVWGGVAFPNRDLLAADDRGHHGRE